MDVEAASEQLVHEVLAVIVGQLLPRVDYSVHIGLHKVCDDVNVFISCLTRWFLYIYESNNVLMIKEF